MKKLNKESDKKIDDQQRRDFVKKSTLVGVGVVAGSALPGAAIAEDATEKPATKEQKGYQVTQHVIDYYKSAAI